MEQIGEMNMKFKNMDQDIYYYDVRMCIGGIEKKIVLPRYDPMLGWIEIFGFPPQHEWVVLADIKPFSKKATLSINGEDIQEKVDFNLNKKDGKHEIITTREHNGSKEVFVWTEDYVNAPELIKDTGVFEHERGVYTYTEEKSLVTEKAIRYLNDEQKSFIKNIIDKHGKPDAIWKKTFTSSGVLPQIFYKMFPIEDSMDFSKSSGFIIEVGYLEKEGATVDGAHGNWYKFLSVDNKQFYIEEGNYSLITIKVNGEEQHIKDTYTMKLFKMDVKLLVNAV